MKPIEIISQDLFDKIRSRFNNLEMGNEEGGITIDPSEARFFDFDFVVEESNLGRISISINDPGSLKIYYSQGITEDQESVIKKYWFNFLKEMRYFAMRRLLRFDTRDISKENLDKNDFQYLASTKPKEDQNMKMNESRWTGKNSSKTSRRVQGKTQVIVRHKQKVNEMLPADRSKSSNIISIFIQNADGERFKSPFNYLPLAFALAQHIDHGGVPYDLPAKKIINMCEQIAQLNEFKKHVKTSTLHGDTLGIVDRAIGRLNELKTTLTALGKSRNYESWIAEFNEQEHNDETLSELDPITFENYKSKFTHSSFNEELAKLFPLIHSIMQEKIDLEEYVKEDTCSVCHNDPCKCDEKTTNEDSFDEFVEWTESIVSDKLDLNAINKNLNDENLIQALDKISLGPGGSVAWGELSNIFNFDESDSDNNSLKIQLEKKAETADNDQTGLNGPAMDVFKGWIEDVHPTWKNDLPELFTDQQTTPEPESGMQTPVEPQQGENPDTIPNSAADMNPAVAQQPVAEDTKNTIMQEIIKTVKRFYNLSNEDVGPFKSEESVCLEVKKSISEKYGDSAGERASIIAKNIMEKLTKKWEITHKKHKEELAPVNDTDGLARLKELIGNIKTKVESKVESETQQNSRDVTKQDNMENSVNLPEYTDRIKKLAGIIDKK